MKHSIQTLCLIALAFLYTSCSDDDPQPPNSQPTIEVSDDIAGMTGENQIIQIVAVDPDGDALDYSWNIIESPSGSGAELTNTNDLNATFNTATAGLYKVEITVDDARGGIASGIVTLYIGGVLPTSISENTVHPNLFDDPIYPDYFALQDIQVTAGVTFDSGVVVESAGDVRLWFNGNSSYLKAEGTSSKHIIFRGIDKVKGGWRGISIASNNVNNKFDYVDILHTGSSNFSSQKTAVHLQSNVAAKLSIKNTSISQSAGYAIYIDGNSGVISSFENNNFNNNDKAPMRIGAENLYVLDKNSVFTNNAIQAIEVSSGTNARFDNAGTIPALSIPYHFYSSAEIRATVTFEAGVTCLFDAGKRLWVPSDGAIIANGTASNKIKFSGLTAAAGAWFGFEIASPSVQNLINYAEVSFGGSSGGRGANIYMFGDGAGSKLTITNSTISNSETYGIRAASGVATLTQSANTFSSNGSDDIRQD
ncbi:MAG: hypothetical protein KDC93_17150 [Cyclobacteriaceae bacterium]|nr:hypothetical protein [Cyclobacteriaceae bacterium]